MTHSMDKAKKKTAKKKPPRRAKGAKLRRKRKAGVRVPPAVRAAARTEIKAILAASQASPETHAAIEREWVGLVVSEAKLSTLLNYPSGMATVFKYLKDLDRQKTHG